MPERMLRDWTDSEAVDKISWQAECLFVRLIMKADDYGRYHGNPKLLRSLLFPLKDGLRDADISRWIAECETAGLIRVYTDKVSGKPFIEIRKFGQRLRTKKARFPDENGNLSELCSKMQQSAADCSNPPQNAAECGIMRLEEEEEVEEEKKRVTNVTQKEKISFSDQLPQHLQTESFRKKWQEWENFRRKKRKPISQIAFSRQVKELEKWTEEQATEAVDFSIASDYQALVMPYSRQKNAHFKKDYSGI